MNHVRKHIPLKLEVDAYWLVGWQVTCVILELSYVQILDEIVTYSSSHVFVLLLPLWGEGESDQQLGVKFAAFIGKATKTGYYIFTWQVHRPLSRWWKAVIFSFLNLEPSWSAVLCLSSNSNLISAAFVRHRLHLFGHLVTGFWYVEVWG